ncbi:hypothetical protein KKD80_02320 [Patescibacteria group bacterium]|nr:hypothetical protein [Patescibacteria group bacterium]
MEEKKGCRGNRVDDEEQKGAIEKELEGAIVAGKAPSFEVIGYNQQNRRMRTKKSVRVQLSFNLVLLLDGRLIEVTAKQTLRRRTKNGRAFDGRLGSVDLMERALRGAILRRWPKIRSYLKQMRISDYSAVAADYNQSHHVRPTFRVICHEGSAPRAVTLEGVDTIDTTFDALVIVFHWLSWRLLRRLRGEERKNGKR